MSTVFIPIEAIYYRAEQIFILNKEKKPYVVYFKPDEKNAVKYYFEDSKVQVLTHTEAIQELIKTLSVHTDYQAVFINATINVVNSNQPETPSNPTELAKEVNE